MSQDPFDNVAKQIQACKKCPLHKGRTHAVPGVGDPNAEIVFIGEGPGRDEDLKGEPFVGAAGKFLDQLLESIDLTRKDVFITNVVKCRPPNNRDPLPKEVETCWPYLKAQIATIKPLLIVTLGRHALNRFIPDLSITKEHGRPKRYRGIATEKQVYFPMYHPAAALYNPGLRPVLLEDIQKIPLILKKLKEDG